MVEKRIAFPILKAEMVRAGIDIKDIGKCINKNPSAVYAMMRGDTVLSLDQAKKIKSFLKTDMPLEDLFGSEE